MTKQTGSCHCGKVKFNVEIDLTKPAISCNCSICQRKGTLLLFVGADHFQLISGDNNLTNYQFGKKSIHHTFCSTCGVTAFATGKMPDGTPIKAINARCIDGIHLDELTIQQYDGKSL